jgi:hypothetical protein
MKLRPALLGIVLLTLLACSRLTLENYSKISMGMAYDDVVKLLGAPASCDDVIGVRSCKWGDDAHSVNVNFVGGKVLLFSSINLK